MNLSARLKELRSSRNWTQSDLAKYSGVSLDSIKGYESSKTKNITMENLKKIAIAFNLDVDNFYNEHLSLKPSLSQSDFVHKLSLGPSNLKKQNATDDKANENGVIAIPYFEDTYASTEDGAINYDEAPSVLEFTQSFLRGFLRIKGDLSKVHIINAKGDSMESTITNGELLFINSINNESGVISGYIYVINYDGDVFVKRLEKNPVTKAITLFSDNKKYEPIVIKGDDLNSCNIIGRVVAHMKKT